MDKEKPDLQHVTPQQSDSTQRRNTSAHANFEIGMALVVAGDSFQAIEAFNRALEIQACPEYCLHLAQAYSSVNQYDDVFAVLDYALELDSQCGDAYYLRATYLQLLGRFDEALEAFHASVLAMRNNDLAQSWFDYGALLKRMRRWKDARNAFSRAFHINPNFYEAVEEYVGMKSWFN